MTAMRPQDAGPLRRELRRTLKGIPRGRRSTHKITTTYGRGQAWRDRVARRLAAEDAAAGMETTS